MKLTSLTLVGIAMALLAIGCTHDPDVPPYGGGGAPDGGGGNGGGGPVTCPVAQISDLPDWSKAGYRGGQPLPDGSKVATTIDAAQFGVVADDGKDDSLALQAAIDSLPATGRDFDHFAVVQLPPGELLLSEQIAVDKSFVIVRGRGSDATAAQATRIVVRPSTNMRWDVLENVDELGNATASPNGDQPGLDVIKQGSASGGWLWPGRGAFRAQTRLVHPAYASEYQAAPKNRKELFEGTVNVHWKVGLTVDQTVPLAARIGDTQIKLTAVTGLEVGQTVQVLDANSIQMYKDTGVAMPDFHTGVPYNRMQLFTVTAINGKTITLDKPLEFDLLANDTADGSPALSGKPILSKVVPLTLVQGVGFESFSLRYDLNGLPKLSSGTYAFTRTQVKDDYGNVAPEYALHGIVLKWVTDSWVKNVHTEMTGSHPIVTEVARHLTIEDNTMTAAYNKGKGGNGYFRGSRVWDSLFRGNVLRELRHFTLQWSSSGNVVTGNDMDNDMNFHGGWERNNLVEHNVIRVGYDHRAGACTQHCGAEGGAADSGQWYPIWWGAGAKAQKWSGASGPRNVLFANVMEKQVAPGGPFVPFAGYDDRGCPGRVVQLGWSRQPGGGYQHLATAAGLIADWSTNENVDFSSAPNLGINADFVFGGATIYTGP